MIEKTGDLWTYPAEYRCITTNGIVGNNGLIMGKGIALQAKLKYPNLPKTLGQYIERWGNRPFILLAEKLITFPTKKHYKDSSDIWLIKNSAELIIEIVNKFKIKSVAMSRPGCGNGGLAWDFVKPWIENIFDDRFIVLDNT